MSQAKNILEIACMGRKTLSLCFTEHYNSVSSRNIKDGEDPNIYTICAIIKYIVLNIILKTIFHYRLSVGAPFYKI